MGDRQFITRRDGIWHYVRRVPGSVAEIDKRVIVKQSTKIRVADDPRGVKAAKVATRINEQFEAYWRGLGAGQALEAQRRYDEARRRAKVFGFDYLQTSAVGQMTHEDDVLDRLYAMRGDLTRETVAALGGREAPPQITLDKLLDEYEALTAASRRDMSADQLRKWRNPRQRAVANLVAVVGARPVGDLTRDDAIKFQEWWIGRIMSEELDVGTGNREIGVVSGMINTLDRRHRLGLARVFGDLRIEGQIAKSRSPMSPAFVQTRLLAPGALDMLNAQARDLVYLIAETGLRLSEATNLIADSIDLGAEVPHIRVRPDGRRMKTPQSHRDIPLVGAALEAMRRNPDGFPRYRDKAASFSAAVNKTLGENGLLEPKRTIYSLRHTFEDRLSTVEAPEKLIAALMGHKYSRPKYGEGPSLTQKREWLQRIAFDGPGSAAIGGGGPSDPESAA